MGIIGSVFEVVPESSESSQVFNALARGSSFPKALREGGWQSYKLARATRIVDSEW